MRMERERETREPDSDHYESRECLAAFLRWRDRSVYVEKWKKTG
jgi:hypothetical protein